MQEKSWLTIVIGIGKKGNLLLSEVQSRMNIEKTDVRKDDDMALCRFWSLSAGANVDTAVIEQNCRDIAIAFLLLDASDTDSVKAAQEIGKFVGTQRYAVSIALLIGADYSSNISDMVGEEFFSAVDAAIDLVGEVDKGGFAPTYMAYSIIHGVNSLIVKPGLIGLDAADMNEQLQKAGMLHVGFEIARENAAIETIDAATESVLSQVQVPNAKRVLLCIDGNENTLDLEKINTISCTIVNAMPEANVVCAGSVSESSKYMIQVLLIATDR